MASGEARYGGPREQPRRSHALVTGASSGIGAALALRLAREGYSVSLCARREEALGELASRIGAEGGRAVAVPADVGRLAEMRKAVEEAEAALGPVDLLVANAGVGITAPVHKLRLEWIDSMVDVNLKGALYAVGLVLPGMLERRRGHVVGVSSLASYRGLPGSAIYSATKAGLSTFLEGIRAEAALYGVAVTDVCPGFVDTPMTKKNRDPMPFLLDAESAAERILGAIRSRRAHLGFPLPLELLTRLVRVLPNPVFDFLARLTLKQRFKGKGV